MLTLAAAGDVLDAAARLGAAECLQALLSLAASAADCITIDYHKLITTAYQNGYDEYARLLLPKVPHTRCTHVLFLVTCLRFT